MNKKTTQTPVAGSETTEARHHNKLHQITKAGSTTLTHDSSGNITDDGSRLLAYDAMNRVKTITRKSDSAVLGTYTYDAFGRRIQKVIADLSGGQGGLSGNITAGTTDYLYDGMQCVEQRNGSNNPDKQYIWGLYVDELLEMKANISGTPADYYPLQDLLYRTAALTNSSGTIVETYDTDAYGRTLIFNATAATPDGDWWDDDEVTTDEPLCDFIFTGRRYDPESEIYFYRARYYNQELGRFISKDPIGYMAGSMSLYEYVMSDPNYWVDPHGLLVPIILLPDSVPIDIGISPRSGGSPLDPIAEAIEAARTPVNTYALIIALMAAKPIIDEMREELSRKNRQLDRLFEDFNEHPISMPLKKLASLPPGGPSIPGISIASDIVAVIDKYTKEVTGTLLTDWIEKAEDAINDIKQPKNDENNDKCP